jgi:uncharacterized Ntn-hydrolase superfamily protein
MSISVHAGFFSNLNKFQMIADRAGVEGFVLRVWDTHEDRIKGNSRTEDLSFDTLLEAIERAREIYMLYSLACVEVVSDDELEKSFFHLSCNCTNRDGDFVK